MAIGISSVGTAENTPSPSSDSQERAVQAKKLAAMQAELNAANTQTAEAKQAFASRQGDIVAGTEFAKDILGPEGLGRLAGDTDLENVMAKRRELAGGLTGPEMQAQRDTALSGINRATQSQSRELRAAQASAGLRGGTAAQQQMQVLGQGANLKANFERDLLLRNRAEQTSAIGNLEASVTGVRKFDLGQAAAEKQALSSGALGFAQLGLAERTGKQQAEASKASAAASSGGGGK